LTDISVASDDARPLLRQRLRDQRRSLTAQQRRVAELRAMRHLARLGVFRQARRLGVYFSVDGEFSIDRMMTGAEFRNKQLYAPVLRQDSLRFAFLHDGAALIPNRFGIPEPQGGVLLDPRFLDLVLTPMVAFDDRGVRLGMGGGYYDRCFRFLKCRSGWIKPKLIGVGYDFQRVPYIQSQSWDVRLWCAVTEERAHLF